MSNLHARRLAFGLLALMFSSSCLALDIPRVCKTIDIGSGSGIKTINVDGQTYDAAARNNCPAGTVVRYLGDPGDQTESQKPTFILRNNAVLKNVVIGDGSNSGTNRNYRGRGGDGIHCYGSCSLLEVYWDDVGEDAATFKNNQPSDVFLVQGGGARLAKDKTFQHNGPGIMKIEQFEIERAGKLYRSCGNCKTQYSRTVYITDVIASDTGVIAGINSRYANGVAGDKATLTRVSTSGRRCAEFLGVTQGEPSEITPVPGACTVR
ncbi:pectate lyase [Lysobacter sp. K5869]|uniref:pectate lyase n=1 Tax=Lysobacter sp. K5869 TaxID=2820808 RepID=UPI001C0625C1|nr:pectate lyase [Lysobacter sp. K5869]QWP75294.1 pectate lyase [Lysobacter sp. K5869]